MKQMISLLMVLAMMLTLWGCGSEPDPTTAATHTITTPATEPRCIHIYTDADCTTPKTCTLCGTTRGSALGHDYYEGVCARCNKADATYVALLDGLWSTDAINENGSQLERISLQFREDGSLMFAAGIYDRLADVPEDQREQYIKDEDNLYDYSGELYYFAGYGVHNILSYTIDGNMITCILGSEEEILATMILERTAGNMLTVTYFEEGFSIYYLQIGDVLVS